MKLHQQVGLVWGMLLSSSTVWGSLNLQSTYNKVGYLSEPWHPIPKCGIVPGCSNTKVDRCCVPKMGRLLFSVQWVDRTGPPDKFTVHGFWPDKCDGKQGPRSGCDYKRNYPGLIDHLTEKNQTLVRELGKHWPSYTGNNPKFWAHEWTKHGTCVSTLEPRCYPRPFPKYQDAHDFFIMVLNLYKRVDYYLALKQASIVPGRVYTRDAMVQAIKAGTGLDVVLTCRGKNLREIRTWFQALGKDQFTPYPDTGHSHSCPKSINYQRKAPSTSEEFV